MVTIGAADWYYNLVVSSINSTLIVSDSALGEDCYYNLVTLVNMMFVKLGMLLAHNSIN